MLEYRFLLLTDFVLYLMALLRSLKSELISFFAVAPS